MKSLRWTPIANLAWLLLGATSTHAVTVYQYASNAYTTAEAPWTTAMRLEVRFTLPAPLASNLSGEDLLPDVLAFTIDDGVFLYDADDVTQAALFVSTDARRRQNAA